MRRKPIIYAALAALLAGVCIAPVAASGVAKADSEANVPDLGGYEVVIGDWWSDPNAEPANATAQALKEYREEMMEKYNFTIVQKAICQWSDQQSSFVDGTQAGDPIASVHVLDKQFVAQPLANHLFKDISKLSSWDLSDRKFNQSTVELMTRGNAVYGFSIGAGDTDPILGIHFNKRLLKECGFDENYIYDLQASGEWTWDKFEELCKACTKDTDGDGTIDLYALSNYNIEFLSAAVTSNDVQWVTKDANGMYVNNTTSREFIDSCDWVYNIWKNYEMPQPEGSEWSFFIAAFLEGKAVMQVGGAYKSGQEWLEMEDDFGFVMFPKGPRAKTYLGQPMDNVYVIPCCISDEDCEKIAFALNIYADQTPPGVEEDPDKWKNGYYSRYRDERAVDETLTMMRDPAHQLVSYVSNIYGLQLGDVAYGLYAGQSAAELVEAMKGSWDEAIREANEAYWVSPTPTATPIPTQTPTSSAEEETDTETVPDQGDDYILPLDYNMSTGSDSEWSEDSTEGLVFVSNASFDKFECVKVDGVVIDAENYDAVSGSTRITLKPDYLKTLSDGKHTITIVSKDGSASANFSINLSGPVSPATGAAAGLGLTCALLAVLSAMTGIVVEKRKKK